MRAIRIALISLGIVVLGALAAGSYLLGREDVPEQTTYRLEIPELRRLAASLPGARPIRLNHQLVAVAHMPLAAVFAGEPFDPHPMTHGAYQIVYPEGFIVVDAAMTPEAFREMAGENDTYDEEAWTALESSLERADAVVITHEHADHLNGIVAHPRPENLTARVRMNPEQLADETIDEAMRSEVERLEYQGALALAPGVVLVRAAGHTPGTQLVYVALADGTEWLLLGDVAWHMRQIEELHYRPRLVTDFFLGEDRAAVLAQFRTLHALMQEHPEVQQVVSHDADQRAELIAAGRLGGRFD